MIGREVVAGARERGRPARPRGGDVETEALPARAPRQVSPLEAAFVTANEWFVIAIMATMSVLVVTNVVTRYVLNFSIVWVEEVTRYMMVWVGFVGSGLVLRYGAHIAVDAFQDVVPAAIARVVRGAIVVLLAATFAYLTWLGARYVGFAWDQETPILNWNTGMVLLAIPIGSALMLVHLLLVARGYVRGRQFETHEAFSADEALL
jgi:TRAP-type transport system small permease protein